MGNSAVLNGRSEQYDFFLSRRGGVAGIAREVADLLIDNGYRVFVQDYDIPLAGNLILEMHDGIKNSRDLIVLFTRDYEESHYTRAEFSSFTAQNSETRRIIIFRCDDAPLSGLFAPHVYQDLVGISDPEERKKRILDAAEGRSQALPPPPRQFVGVPPRIANFRGRTNELHRLDASLIQNKPTAVTQTIGRAAVQGLGGIGKTSLAIEYAYRFRDLYAGVWWCRADTRERLLTNLADLAISLGSARADEGGVEKAAKAALRRLAEQRATWLLVYDNVSSPEEIADLLPSAGARLIITSRFSDFSPWAEEITLGVLPLEEAVALLQNRADRKDAAGAKTLAESLGCLPLALDHAAAYCKRTQVRFADYAAKAASLIATVPRGSDYPRSVAATFDLAISQAASQCASTEVLMGFLSQCAPERIPMLLVEGAIDDEGERLQALAALAEVSLLKHDPFDNGTEAVTVHRLVQAIARARLAATDLAQVVADRVITRLAAVYPREDSNKLKSRPLCAQLTPHLLAHHALGATPTAACWPELLNRAGDYLLGRAVYTQAASLLREALAIRERALGPEHRDTAESLHSLSMALKAQGDFVGARALLERALAIRERALGPEHPDTAQSLNNLGMVLQGQGDLVGALQLLERSLAIRERALGLEHPDTAQSLNNLAATLWIQANLGEARLFYERALAILEKVHGAEHPDTATTLNNLALVVRAQGDFAAARPLFERALETFEKLLGPEHPNTAIALSNLAGVLQTQGALTTARPLHERALTIAEKVLGHENWYTAQMLSNLANLLRDQGDFAAALPLYERALAIGERFGADHYFTASILGNFATLLQSQGDLARAQPLFERAVTICEKTLGPEHPGTAEIINGFANLLRARADFARARPLFERALIIAEKAFGTEHPSTNRVRCNLARFFLETGNATESLRLAEVAKVAHERTFGKRHKWTKESARVLAASLDEVGREEDAMALREQYGLSEAQTSGENQT
jgi:tetratricopeptide (TPR) repeat protein